MCASESPRQLLCSCRTIPLLHCSAIPLLYCPSTTLRASTNQVARTSQGTYALAGTTRVVHVRGEGSPVAFGRSPPVNLHSVRHNVEKEALWHSVEARLSTDSVRHYVEKEALWHSVEARLSTDTVSTKGTLNIYHQDRAYQQKMKTLPFPSKPRHIVTM